MSWEHPNPVRGSRHCRAKLDEEKARRILYGDLSTWSAREISDLFGVSVPTVKKLRAGLSWTHV